MWGKFLIIQVLVFLAPGVSASSSQGCRSSQEATENVERDLRATLANMTRTYTQVDELLAPVSTFLQAALMKQVLAEYGVNSCNTV